MNGTPLPQILHMVTLVSYLLLSNARLLQVTFSSEPGNYFEFKL